MGYPDKGLKSWLAQDKILADKPAPIVSLSWSNCDQLASVKSLKPANKSQFQIRKTSKALTAADLLC